MIFNRKIILASLKNKVARKEAIIGGGAGIGLVALVESIEGIDFIMAYPSEVYSMQGFDSNYGRMPYGDCNSMTLDLGRRILPRVQDTPVIAGVGAGDPYRDIERFIDQLIKGGFSGITNMPTVGGEVKKFIQSLDNGGIGYKAEVEMVRLCNKMDVFSIAYVFDDDQVKDMAGEGADVICVHCGKMLKGTGAGDSISLGLAGEKIQKFYEIAHSENPEALVLFHGGPFWNKETVRFGLEHTNAHGFIGAGYTVQIPIENEVLDAAKKFRELKLQ